MPDLTLAELGGIHASIAEGLADFGGILRCEECKRESELANIAGYLRTGWPECCGSTMTWITASQLVKEVAGG